MDVAVPTHLRLVGGFELTVDGTAVELPAACQRLVALVALRGRLSRGRAAGTLWPDAVQERALACLRSTLWRLQHLAPGVVAGTTTGLVPFPALEVDVDRLVRGSLDVLAPEPSPSWRDLLTWLDELGNEAGLLPDWDEPWLLADRERLRQIRLHVLEAVAGHLCRRGCHGLALEAALAALREDELRETAHRAVIRVHLAEGNLAEARRAYEHCRQTMLREVGVEPSPSVQCLFVPSPARPAASPAAVPFPGRVSPS